MKIILGADEEGPAFQAAVDYLRDKAEIDVAPVQDWPSLARLVGEAVAEGRADMGVLMCWTGTGTSMMANKVPGVRAALCWEPWIAEGARRWNDANVLVMSLKRTDPPVVADILEAWMSVEQPDADELANIRQIHDYENRR